MWETGSRVYDGVVFHYDVKAYPEPSEYGINGGKISKLFIKSAYGDEVMYDREWVIFPKNSTAMNIFLDLIDLFN